ncbi:MAG: RidA family protein [Oligoflexia bacterium]|nr:RidA family protein [Oligoflexia bacterium]
MPIAEKDRYNLASGSLWEPLRGYSRAVKVGDQLFISGTTAVDQTGEVVGPNDAFEQTRYVIRVINKILREAGFKPTDIVRTRLYVTDMSKWKEYARAHREAFENIRPASSIVQVTKLVDPRLMIEMEAEAVLGSHLVETLKIVYPET